MLANTTRPIGAFDEQVTILTQSTSVDAAGQPVDTWSVGETLWGRAVPQRGVERFTASQVVGKAVLVLELREYRALTVLQRVRFRGKDWDIHDVRQIGRQEGVEMDISIRSED